MKNPWEEIQLDPYEKHMSLDSVQQLQAMNAMMKEQLEAYPVESAMILGIAGGNGLEHVRAEKYRTVYGVDINAQYLQETAERHAHLSGILSCLKIDLLSEFTKLPSAELLIANLLIEYIGYSAFQKVVQHVAPHYVSCAIQINTNEKQWVSDSPYIHDFDGFDAIHHQMEAGTLIRTVEEIGYAKLLQLLQALPNGKSLVRLDFKKKD